MTDSIRAQFWKALEDSPFLMIELTGSDAHAIPMTAQLDKNANSAFWFYGTKDSRIAGGGPAMAQFAAQGHDLFACISGTLREETDPAVIDRYWSNQVAAWYEGGRSDPNLLMLRFDLGDAEIWTAEPGVKGRFKMITGMKMSSDEMGRHADIKL